MNDAEFVRTKKLQTIKVRKFGNIIPVGKYLFIARDGEVYRLYNRKLETLILDTPFSSIQTVYLLAERIESAYRKNADDDYLFLLTESEWADQLFWVCRWSVNHGHKWLRTIEKLKAQDLITDEIFRECLA